MTITVLLADDHAVVRDGLGAVLGAIDGFEVVAEAVNGDEAVRAVRRYRPDVVLMDVRMPEVDGVEATRRIQEFAPQTAILMLTMFDNDATVLAAMKAGARGYLLKDAGHEEITTAIRAVAGGQTIFGPAVAGRVVGLLAGTRDESYPFPQLADREREVLAMLTAGRRTREIAAALHLSPKTISNQLTAIFHKLNVADRSEAILRAREHGLGLTE